MYYMFYLFLHLFSYLCLNTFATCVSNAYDLLGFVAAPLLYLHCISFSVKIYLSILYLYMHIYIYIHFFSASLALLLTKTWVPHLSHRQVLHVPFSMIPKWFGSLGIGWFNNKNHKKSRTTGNVGPWGTCWGLKKPTTTWENISVKWMRNDVCFILIIIPDKKGIFTEC